MRDDDDDTLVARAGRGDETAFNRLVRRHTPALHRIALRYSGSTAEADEIVSHAFWKLWTRVEAWKPGRARLSTWLARVAINSAIDRARRKRLASLFVPIDDDFDAHDENALGGDRSLGARQELARTLAAMRTLPARQRMAITLASDDTNTRAWCAEAMGINENAFAQLLHRARSTLKTKLDEDRAGGTA